MDKINNKKGNIEIILVCFFSIFFIFIYFLIYFIYSKINLNIYSVKQDLFYIAQNAILACNKDELAYNNFNINHDELVKKLDTIIKLNYDNVELIYVKYDKEDKKVNLVVEVDLNLDKWKLKDKVKIEECIKVDMMEIRYEE